MKAIISLVREERCRVCGEEQVVFLDYGGVCLCTGCGRKAPMSDGKVATIALEVKLIAKKLRNEKGEGDNEHTTKTHRQKCQGCGNALIIEDLYYLHRPNVLGWMRVSCGGCGKETIFPDIANPGISLILGGERVQ